MAKPADLEHDPVRSLFFKYYVPALTSLLSITIHQVANGIILGRYAGRESVAAVGIFGPVMTVFIAFALALMIGGGILVGRSIGAKDFSRAQHVFEFTTTLGVLFGAVIILCAPLVTTPLTRFLVGDDIAIVQPTHDYMFWGFLWMPLFLLRMLWGNCISSDGAPKVSRNATLLAVLLNILFDVLFIIIIPLGAAGASIATGLAVLSSVIYLYVYLRKESGHLSVRRFRFTTRLNGAKELFNYGVPSFVSEISFSLGLMLINKSLVPYGALAIAAFGIINHISFIFLRLQTAAMISALPIMSFNIGARLPQRVLGTLRFAMVFTFTIGILTSVIGFVFPGYLLQVFSGKMSTDYLALAAHATGLYFLLFIAAGPNFILGAYLQSTKNVRLSVAINFFKGLAFVVLFLSVLPDHLQADGVWLSRALAEACTLLLIGGYTLVNVRRYYNANSIVKPVQSVAQ